MTTRTLALIALLATTTAGSALAQTPPATPQPGQAPRARGGTPPPAEPRSAAPAATAAPAAPSLVPRRAGRPINVKIDVTITDRGGAAAIKKTVSVVTGDGLSGFIRSQAFYSAIGEVPLNIDTEPELLTDGKIRVRVNLQYDLPGTAGPGEPGVAGRLNKTQIRENLAVILENGKSLVVAQSADPVGDRQTIIEITATILR